MGLISYIWFCPDSPISVGRDAHIPPHDFSFCKTAGFNGLCVEFPACIHYNRP